MGAVQARGNRQSWPLRSSRRAAYTKRMARYEFIAAYLLTNRKNGTLYAGSTSDLVQRMEQHKLGQGSKFAAAHGCDRLVWYQRYETMEPALAQERRLKGWLRTWKIALIEKHNPDWRDLSLEPLF